MRFYNTQHDYYCGIDLHARILYVCILDSVGNTVAKQKTNNKVAKTQPEPEDNRKTTV